MSTKEEERALVNSSEVRRLEKTLNKIEIEEQKLIDEFDLNAESILGLDIILKLSKANLLPFSSPRDIPGKGLARHPGILTNLHKSMIADLGLRQEFEDMLKAWFKVKTEAHKELFQISEKFLKSQLEETFALASLGITAFHKLSDMRLYDVQKLAGIAIAEENMVEVKTGEGKTLAGVLPTFLYALTGQGSHVITANPYLSERDYNELKPIYEGLGLTCGYVIENETDLAISKGMNLSNIDSKELEALKRELKDIKRKAYNADVTFGSKAAFAFDYLRDSAAKSAEDFVQRDKNPGFAYVDEVDDALIDDAESPYVLGDNIPVYNSNMTAEDLAKILGRSFEDLREKGKQAGLTLKRFDKIDYPYARSLAVTLYSEELLPNQRSYQGRAQNYFEKHVKDRVFIVKDGTLGYSAKELYELLTNEEKIATHPDPQIQAELREQVRKIKEESSVIYYPDGREFIINEELQRNFLIDSYFAFQINSVARLNEASIVRDPSYINGKDYIIVDGAVQLMMNGALRLVQDPSHPEFSDDYNRYLFLIDNYSLNATHYFNQAIKANIMLKSPEEYVVHEGVVKVVKNGRIQEDSTYTDGLHQAIEFKEKINPAFYKDETRTIASVTQKAFYSRYRSLSGATGSASPDIFSTIYNKNTVKVPRHAFYEHYSNRAKMKAFRNHKKPASEPIGVYNKPTHFTLEKNDKAKAIVRSILESKSQNPQQPILLVVSDPTELAYLKGVLAANEIVFSTIDATTSKEDEAKIIARAGLPGKVTLSTEKAGRGTDIKLGGDRETLIDLATSFFVKKEEKEGRPITDAFDLAEIRRLIDIRATELGPQKGVYTREEEKAMRESLWQTGLKVISSGYFNVDRIDRQLEGRTGRNGQSGTCERYVSREDLEFIGVDTLVDGMPIVSYLESLGQDSNGTLNVDDKARKQIERKVKSTQRENEGRISAIIKNAQDVSQLTSNTIEKIREQRRDIIFSNVDYDMEMYRAIEDGLDAILISYVDSSKLNKRSVIEEIRDSRLDLDVEAFALEVKETFGLAINVAALMATDVNLLELRNAVLETVRQDYHKKKYEKTDEAKIELNEQTGKALLDSKDFLISHLPNVSKEALTEKSMLMLGGKGEEADFGSLSRFDNIYRLSVLEAAKIASQSILGVPLTLEEKSRLEDIKQRRFESSFEIVGEEVLHSNPTRELSADSVDKFKKIVEKQSRYSNLNIRPLMFAESSEMPLSFVLVHQTPEFRAPERDLDDALPQRGGK